MVARRDPAAARTCVAALARAGHEVRTSTITNLEATARAMSPDLVVCEVSPDTVEEVLAALNAAPAARPLLLAIVERASHAVPVLDAGADAYLLAPFGLTDLEVHAAALLRRWPGLASGLIEVGPLTIDTPTRSVRVEGREVRLTRKEFDILAALAAAEGRIVSKARLLTLVWGYDAYDENLVEVHVSVLRRRLPPAARAIVQTVRGAGYRLFDPGAQGRTA